MGNLIICNDTTKKKIYVSPQEVYDSSFELASQILQSGFKPDVMFAVLRGGAPTAIIVNEVMQRAGYNTKFAATLTKAYKDDNSLDEEKIVKIGGYTLEPWNIYEGSKILLLEDTHDSGISLSGLIADMIAQGKGVKRENIKVAVMDYKELKFQEPLSEVKIRRLYSQFVTDEIINEFYEMIKTDNTSIKGDFNSELSHFMKHKVHTLGVDYVKPDFFVNKYVVDKKDNSPWIWYPHELMGNSQREIEVFMGKYAHEATMLADKLRDKNKPK